MAKGDKRPFAVFDIDGTLVRWQLYHAIADELMNLGFIDEGAYDSVRIARMNWKSRVAGANFKTYEAELIRVYEQILSDITISQFERATKAVFDEYKDQVYIYTKQLIEKLKKDGYVLLAISGSQIEIVELVAKHYGFTDFIGTVYERSGEKFSGKSTVGSRDKARALNELVAKHGLDFKGSIAIGDSLSDASMLELVESPIAFNPDKDLFKQAEAAGWKIIVERKNMIYELEHGSGKYQLVKTNAG